MDLSRTDWKQCLPQLTTEMETPLLPGSILMGRQIRMSEGCVTHDEGLQPGALAAVFIITLYSAYWVTSPCLQLLFHNIHFNNTITIYNAS